MEKQEVLREAPTSYGGDFTTSVPQLPPPGKVIHLTRQTLKQLASRERAEQRIAAISGIPAIEKEIAELEKLSKKLGGQIDALAKTLPKFKPDEALWRIEAENKIAALQAEMGKVMRMVGAKREQIAGARKAAEDASTEWATARRDWCERVLPIVQGAQAEAAGMLTMIERELATGRVDPSRQPLKKIKTVARDTAFHELP